MKRYSNYISKQENQWFDSVPEEWEVIALKHITYYVKTGSTPSTKERKYYENGNIDWYTPEDLNTLVLNKSRKQISSLALQDGQLKLFKANSLLLVGIGATIGKVGLLTKDATSNQQINSIFFNKKLIPKFGLFYFYSIAKILNEFSSTSTMGIFNQSKTKAIYVPVPPLLEQQSIVNFLDYKTYQIDQFIANRQRQIELLNEQKTSLINKAVTEGINKDTLMKESGLNWLPLIPDNSNVISLKHLVKTKITDGPHLTPKDVESGIPFISAEAIQNHTINFNSKWGNISKEDHLLFSKKCKPQNGDIFIVKSGATTGKVAYVNTEIEFNIWSPLALVRADEKKIKSIYLFYFIISKSFQEQIQFSWSFGTQQNIGMGVIQNLKIIVPTLEEQNIIIDYIKSETKNFDELILKYQNQVNLMQEYRTALISQAVTGKIDVRNWKPKSN